MFQGVDGTGVRVMRLKNTTLSLQFLSTYQGCKILAPYFVFEKKLKKMNNGHWTKTRWNTLLTCKKNTLKK